LADVESDTLAFAELIELTAVASGHVEKHVLPAIAGLDETESLVGKSFDRTLAHYLTFSFLVRYGLATKLANTTLRIVESLLACL
jgi:hypothetical protein